MAGSLVRGLIVAGITVTVLAAIIVPSAVFLFAVRPLAFPESSFQPSTDLSIAL
jgi:hypothetical protein